jgi:hypothetical protein
VTLHVTNGDSTAGTLRETDLGGEVVAWRDVLHEGPVPPGDEDDVRRTWARFLASLGGDEARLHTELAARDAALLDALGAGDDVVLWFEHDLYDQLQLVQALSLVAGAGVGIGSLRLICIDAFPGRPRFAGLGELDAAELESLWPERRPVEPATLACAVEVWTAFRQPDPKAVESLLAAELPGLPFLATALRRLLEELPALDDGLLRSERQVLAALEAGATNRTDLMRAAADAEEAPFLGDTWVFDRLGALTRGARPLVAPDYRLTDDGREVLAGRLDRVAAVGIDRWLGGTHLREPEPWRWDRAAGRVVPPSG